MPNQWGRSENYNWPSDKPIWTYTALIVTAALMGAMQWIAYAKAAVLEQYWLPTYFYVDVLSRFHVMTSKYRLPLLQQADGQLRFPTEKEVDPAVTTTADGHYRVPFAL